MLKRALRARGHALCGARRRTMSLPTHTRPRLCQAPPRHASRNTASGAARWAVPGVGDLWGGEERSGTRGSPARRAGPARSHEAAARSAPFASGIAAALVTRAPQRSRRAAPTATVGAHTGYRPPCRAPLATEGIVKRSCAARRRRTGCWCSGRRSSDASGRRRRRRASASSARTWWPPTALTVDRRAPRQRSTRAADVISTKRRSSPERWPAASWSAGAAPRSRPRPAATSRPRRPRARLSISLLTASRISRMRCHFASSASSGQAPVSQ